MTASRRGFTLVELLIALVLLALVGQALLTVLLTMQRVTRRQTEVASMQGSLRSGLQLVQAELLELYADAGADSSDIVSLGAQTLRYRAMRGLGEACQVGTAEVRLRKTSYYGLRVPTAVRDGLLLFLEGDSTIRGDDAWRAVPITAVAGGSSCPDGSEAWSLTVALTPLDVAAAPVPGPVRTYEVMELGLVNDGGQDWLGIRSISLGETQLEPVVGPVTSNGVGFSYFDLAGNPTADPDDVNTILVVLRGMTDRSIGAGFGPAAAANPTDSLTLRIQLRNAR
jgi:prepilin-type N-terminal cleavage/methylation domain-containing protein